MTPKTLKIALAVSVALNVFAVAGAVTYGVNRDRIERKIEDQRRPGREGPLAEVLADLDPTVRDRVRSALRESALAARPDVDGLTFTGETRTGEAIMAAAAKGVRPVSLELGGKNAVIIFDDAALDQTLEGIGRACFANTGQVCLVTERIYVQRGIFDRVAEGLAAKAAAYRFGDPFDPATTMGTVISAKHRAKVLGYYDRARTGGASRSCGTGRTRRSPGAAPARTAVAVPHGRPGTNAARAGRWLAHRDRRHCGRRPLGG